MSEDGPAGVASPGDDPALLSGRTYRDLNGVDLFYWNPLRRAADGTVRPVDNFGDLLGPVLAERMLWRRVRRSRHRRVPRKLFTVGSVLHYAWKGDVVWGSGINGKALGRFRERYSPVDVRAVRGPWTARLLTDAGVSVPAVYGDPALLLPRLMPEIREWATKRDLGVVVVPNLNDLTAATEPAGPADGPAGPGATGPEEAGPEGSGPEGSGAGARRGPGLPDPRLPGADPRWTVVDPRWPLATVLRAVARARLVVGSSLHGIAVADALGIPARFVTSDREDPFKYYDYLAGTGRPATRIATSLAEAVELGGHEAPDVDLDALEAAFPWDLWGHPAQPKAAPFEPDDAQPIWRDLVLAGDSPAARDYLAG